MEKLVLFICVSYTYKDHAVRQSARAEISPEKIAIKMNSLPKLVSGSAHFDYEIELPDGAGKPWEALAAHPAILAEQAKLTKATAATETTAPAHDASKVVKGCLATIRSKKRACPAVDAAVVRAAKDLGIEDAPTGLSPSEASALIESWIKPEPAASAASAQELAQELAELRALYARLSSKL